jgi:hypothetical protein
MGLRQYSAAIFCVYSRKENRKKKKNIIHGTVNFSAAPF